MLQLRPTFSESWYRVATLRPKLRGGAQISRQFYRGDRWYVVRDPAGNQFHRLSDPAYRFVGLLDGRRTIAEAWDLVGGMLADDAPTQPEVIQILSQLYAANLLETDITPDATVLLRRHKDMVKRKLQGRLMNVLFPRMPLWDPDRFLRRWMPVAKVIFSQLGVVLWLIVVIASLVTIVPQWTRLTHASTHAFDLQHNWENLFWLYAVFVFVKLIHELGHAFSCRRFGGECHELGIMLLVMLPTPYVDASTAWGFSSKWRRVFVGAAGMIVELFFAACCGFIWTYTKDDTLINQLAYNAMFIASVSTVIFNANPLLRYDGYYILSDLLEIPNLRQKSTEYSLGLIKRHIFRIKLSQPLPPWGQRFWLLLYAILSSIYRVFIGIMIILLVTFKIPIAGILMAIGGVVTWGLVPVFKVGKYLLLDAELHRKRTRAIAFSSVAMAAIIVAIGLIRFPVHVQYTGVLEPDDPRIDGHKLSGKLIASADGTVDDIYVKDGQHVSKDDPILLLKDPQVDADIKVAEAKIKAYEAELRKAYGKNDLIEAEKDKVYLGVWRERLSDAQNHQNRLTIRAPFSGTLIMPGISELPNVYVARGREVGSVAVLDHLIVRGDIDQNDAQLVSDYLHRPTALDHGHPQIRLAGLLEQALPGGKVEMIPAAVDQIASASLGSGAGGDIVVDPRDPKGQHTLQGQFETSVALDNSDGIYCPGQRAYVRFTLSKKPLIWQWTRKFLQLIETSDTGTWL